MQLLADQYFQNTAVEQDLLSSNLSSGKYKVGFKSVQTLDHTRPSLTSQSRPVRAISCTLGMRNSWIGRSSTQKLIPIQPYLIHYKAGKLELGNKTETKALYEKALALLENDTDLNAGEKSFFLPATESRIENLNIAPLNRFSSLLQTNVQ